MSIQAIPKSVTESASKVKIIDGRQVKVAAKEQVKAISQRLITKHARAMEILKDR